MSIDKDYYWSLDGAEQFDVSSQPNHFTIGQLSECLTNLDEMRHDPISYGLVWLGEILRAVGVSVVR
ncbi:hypothetical protein HJ590_08420 [Naumannella sp. ID2617S]|nr:hypothetical protein [Naumannella sp. ID2617S]